MNKFQTLQNIPNFAFLMDIISCVGFQNYSIEEHFGVYCFKAKFEQKKKKKNTKFLTQKQSFCGGIYK